MTKRSRRRSLFVLGSLPVALGVLTAGCSGKNTTQGEVVVAIETDLSLPKDVSAVRVQISTLGVITFDNTYPVGPSPNLRIPATLGVLAGDHPDAPVRIRVVGFKKEFQPRILREVVTTVPPSRVVSLRVPLQWLSDGSAHVDPLGSGDPNAFVNTCAEGTTNIGGLCTESSVDSTKLPDYVPNDIFGGGDETGSGGNCFDTQKAFATRSVVVPTAQGDGPCTMPSPGGDLSKANMAIEFPSGGDGICADDAGDGPCLVPIDRVDPSSDGLGWYDADAIHFPAGLCKKLGDPKFTGKVVVAEGFDAKTPKMPTCGAWSSVQGGNPGGPGSHDAGASIYPATPVILASGQQNVSAFGIESGAGTLSNVYFAIAGGGINFVSKSGGAVQTGAAPFTAATSTAFHFARDGSGNFDSSGLLTDTAGGTIWTFNKSASRVSQYMSNQPSAGAIAFSATDIAWTTSTGVRICSNSNCATTVVDLATAGNAPTHPVELAAASATNHDIYVTNGDAFIYHCQSSACSSFDIAAQNPGGGGNNAGIAASTSRVAWIDEATNGNVLTASLGGVSTPVTIAKSVDTTAIGSVHRGVVMDISYVYFTAGNGVFAAPFTGGSVITLATNLKQPAAIAVDNDYVYFTDVGDGTIARVPAPHGP